MFDSGISREGDLLELGVKAGLVEKMGAWFQYKEMKLGQGREAAKAFLKGDPATAVELEAKIRELASQGEIGSVREE